MLRYMRKFITRWNKDPDATRTENPTAIRTAEASQLEDAVMDQKSQTPEREAFDNKTYERSQESVEDPNGHASKSGANPFREESQKNI